MVTGGYVLHLYCDRFDPNVIGCNGHAFHEFPHEYIDELGSKCRANAKADGWKVNYKTGFALCPKCNPKKVA